jgi:AcrR family transcriptional regulator
MLNPGERPAADAADETGRGTRQRILEAAAALFARKGFHGTATREIAAEVGIRQPSLFHHFPTKQAILAELLDRDLRPALDRIRRHRAGDAGAAERLYAYLLDDVGALVASPFDARGLYNDDVLLDDDLAEQRRLRTRLHEETRRLIAEGVASGDFRPLDPPFAQQVVSGMLLDTIWVAGTHLADDLADRPAQIADFVLLGMLADPSRLPRVREGASALSAARPPPA